MSLEDSSRIGEVESGPTEPATPVETPAVVARVAVVLDAALESMHPDTEARRNRIAELLADLPRRLKTLGLV